MWHATYSCDHLHHCTTVSIIKVALQYPTVPKIDVSGYVKDELDEIKQSEEHKSYDSAIRTLLGNYDR